MQLGLHIGKVALPVAALLVHVEGVGVGVNQHAFHLAVDDARNKGLQVLILLHKGKVRPHLRGAIPQPHGVDIAGNNEGVGLSVLLGEVYGTVERVGEAVAEEPGYLLVGNLRLHLLDGTLDGRARKVALLLGYAHRRKGLRHQAAAKKHSTQCQHCLSRVAS